MGIYSELDETIPVDVPMLSFQAAYHIFIAPFSVTNNATQTESQVVSEKCLATPTNQLRKLCASNIKAALSRKVFISSAATKLSSAYRGKPHPLLKFQKSQNKLHLSISNNPSNKNSTQKGQPNHQRNSQQKTSFDEKLCVDESKLDVISEAYASLVYRRRFVIFLLVTSYYMILKRQRIPRR